MKSGHMKIFQNVLLIGFLGVFATGCMYPGGRPDYTGSGALSGAATAPWLRIPEKELYLAAR
jgi:hypothetical protein